MDWKVTGSSTQHTELTKTSASILIFSIFCICCFPRGFGFEKLEVIEKHCQQLVEYFANLSLCPNKFLKQKVRAVNVACQNTQLQRKADLPVVLELYTEGVTSGKTRVRTKA